MKYLIKGIGKIILNENSLKMELSISPTKFLEMLNAEIETTSPQTKQALRKAVKTNEPVKIKNFADLKKFFDALYEAVERGKMQVNESDAKQNLFNIITKQTSAALTQEPITIENNPFILDTSKPAVSTQTPQESANTEKIFKFFENLQKKEAAANSQSSIPSSSDLVSASTTTESPEPQFDKMALQNNIQINIVNIDPNTESAYCDLTKLPFYEQKKFVPEIYGELKTSHYFDGSEVSQEYKTDTIFALTNSSNSEITYYMGSFNSQWNIEGFNLKQNERICKRNTLELNDFSVLSIKRHISTKNDPKKPSLIIEPGKDTTILYSFQLENKSEYNIKEIKISQEVCKAFIKEQYSGSDSLEISNLPVGRMFSFIIKELNAKSTKTIDIRFQLDKNADPAKDLYCGHSEILYYVDSFDFGFDKENIQIVLPIETGMKLTQLEEQPEICEISPFFTNPTDLPLKLAEFKIIDRIENTVLYNTLEARTIFPLTKQISYIDPIRLELKEEQHFRIGAQFRFSPIHSQIFSVLKVIAALENKSIGLPEVKFEFAHSIEKIFLEKTKAFYTQITIENTGNTDFDSFLIECQVPEGYTFGDLSDLEIFKEEISQKESPNYRYLKEENGKIFKIQFENLNQKEDSDQNFLIGEIIGIKLPISCDKVELGKIFSINVHYSFTKIAESKITIEKSVESNTIEVIQPVIDLAIKKHFKPLDNPDVFEIVIELKNSGNFPLEQRKYYTEIQSNWELLRDQQSNYSIETINNRTYATWMINSIHPNENYTLKYKIRILDSKTFIFS